MLFEALQRRQRETGYLSDDDLRALAAELGVPLERLEALVSFYPSFRRTPPARATISVCRDLSCHLRGARTLTERLRAKLAGDAGVEVREVSCIGRCDVAPAAKVGDIPVGPADVEGLALLAAAPEKTHKPVPPPRRRFAIDPYDTALDRYGAARALAKGGDRAAEALLAALDQSTLRGRGSTGFEVGRKWSSVRAAAGAPKTVVCNAHESEPGSFKDRELLAQAAHLVLEGMLLGGLTIGAARGVVFVRPDYGPEREALEDEIASARKKGWLGPSACGSGRPFDVEVFVSSGRYVQGEETALLEALEDRPGSPRERPPHPSEAGLFGKPTLVHNVETFAVTPAIATKGAAWWKAQGKRGAAGLALFAVSGHVARPGVYEVPMGTTVSELLSLAGGVPGGKALKAFVPGASSSVLPAANADVPLHPGALAAAGSALGSSVVYVAMGTDLVDLGRNVTAFFRNESCGKCGDCRDGTEKAVAILDDVLAGRAGRSVLDQLPELGETVARTAVCGLGQVALRPLLSILDRFPRDVMMHVGSGLITLAPEEE